MYEAMRLHLDVGANYFPGALCEDHLHTAQQEICRNISSADPSFFVATTALTLVAGTDTYAMPQNARLGTRLVFMEDTGDGDELPPAELRSYLAYQGGIVSLCSTLSFAWQGERLRIMPTPGAAATLRAWYIPSFGNMLEGVCAAISATDTITLFTSPNYTTSWGQVSSRDDYYTGMSVEIIDGVCAGDQRTITDYDGGTKVATVDTAWSADANKTPPTFVINSPVPEEFHDLVPLRAAVLGSGRNRNRQAELTALYYGSPGAAGRVDELLSWVTSRSDAQSEVVGYVDHGD
jgi:hypothetical protein